MRGANVALTIGSRPEDDDLTTATSGDPAEPVSAWAPLRRPLFRSLWLAALAANVGLWMQNVGAAWLMTSLTPSAAMVGLVQAATAGPMVLLGLLAGALADVVDGRRLLLWAQAWMLLAVAGLGALALAGAATPATLLLMTFLFGIGVAMSTPAWQVITLEVVPGDELPAAVSLNAVTLALAYVRAPILLGLMLAPGGVAWLMLLSLFILAALATVPAWVRARATAVVLLVFFGGMTVGSIVWGVAAQVVGTPAALTGAALGLIAGLAAAARFRISGQASDLTPSHHWAEPRLVSEPSLDRGPVLVTVEYRIDPTRAPDFALAMREVRLGRLRDGAMRWDLFSDPAEPGRYVETMLISSWAEHQRSHERVSVADRAVEARAKAFHLGDGPTIVTHLIAERLPDR